MIRTPKAILSFVVGPIRTEIDKDNNQIMLTHLQKYSTCGFLLTWTFCFHVWLFWKHQSQTAGKDLILTNPVHEPLPGESWIPGSEQGFYARTPGWRYDADLGMKWTWGYVGGHWD